MAFSDFIFAMTDALVQQIVARFDAIGWSPLSETLIDEAIPASKRLERGVYLLGLARTDAVDTVYVGQSSKALYARLKRHAKFLQDRCNLPVESVRFKALAVVIFESVALEARLIRHYETKWTAKDQHSGWNGSGIGSNDTGGGRDRQKPSGFDKRFPIDITLTKPDLLPAGSHSAKEIYERVKSIAPYTIRMAPSTLGQHQDLATCRVGVTNPEASVSEVLKMLLRALPEPWCVEVNPVRVLIQRDVRPPSEGIINPTAWPPPEWVAGGVQPVVLRRA